MMMDNISKSNRIESIDIARSLCMLYIIGIWHLKEYTNYIDYIYVFGEYITEACLGFFMIISGYLLSKKNIFYNSKSIIFFLKKRFIRLYPLFCISLFFMVLIGKINPFVALKTAFFISVFSPPFPWTLWFVSMLFLFYFLLPFISSQKITIYGNKRIERRVLITKICILFILLYIVSFLIKIDNRILYLFPCFSFGVIISKNNNIKKYINFYFAIIAFLCFVFIERKIQNLLQEEVNLQWIIKFPLAMFGSIIIYDISDNLAKIKTIVKLLKPVSYASLCCYLFHRQVYHYTCLIFLPQDGIYRVLYFIVICIPMCIIISYFTQLYYDKIMNYLIT